MVISHKYKCVFIHIPKNGGTFVTNFMQSVDPSSQNCFIGSSGHQTINTIIKTYENFHSIKDYTFFAVIRNPIDKILSSFNYYWHSYFNFITFLRKLEFCNKQNLHLTNLLFITRDEELDVNIKLLDFDNLVKELISLFIHLSSSDADLLNVANNIDLQKINISDKKIISSLNSSHNEIIVSHPFMLQELDFWRNFKHFKSNRYFLPNAKEVIYNVN